MEINVLLFVSSFRHDIRLLDFLARYIALHLTFVWPVDILQDHTMTLVPLSLKNNGFCNCSV
jgi:hypothetical protein